MIRVVFLSPTGDTVALPLVVHVVHWCAVDIACHTVTETMELRHYPSHGSSPYEVHDDNQRISALAAIIIIDDSQQMT